MPVIDDLVFLSYAREDEEAASKLHAELVEADIKVWFDQESLTPGANWKLAIRSAIRKSRYFIALMSTRSVSKKGFVQSELRQAIDVLDEYPENETYLIPARLDHCEAPHDRLNDFQWVDLFPVWDKGTKKLLRFFGKADQEGNSKPKQEIEIIKRGGVYAPTVRLDGIYLAKRIRDFDSCLRFYRDGLVIRTSSSGAPQNLVSSFNRESANQKGLYTISGEKIRFSTTSAAGTVDLEGEIQGDNIILRAHSHINGYRAVYEYVFIQLDALSGLGT